MPNVDHFTATDHRERRFLVVPVALVEDNVLARSPEEASWCAHVCDPASPLVGLYAFADSLSAARDAAARTAWSALLAGELAKFGVSAATLSGIYVVATTCDVYDADDLAASLTNDAA
jgi:hypothetical protein